MEIKPVRIVTFCYLPFAYKLLADWVQRNGYHHILLVTTPGPLSRPTPSYKEVVREIPRHVEVLVTTRLKDVAIPLIKEIAPDLIACFTFPYRLPPTLFNIPKFGTVNIHPTVLPEYRGPNVMRQFYDDYPIFGATAHRMDEEFDTGPILSQAAAPMPEIVTEDSVLPIWKQLIAQVIDEGMAQALRGNPGIPQVDEKATYAAAFTEAEYWLNWNEPRRVIQRKMTALNLAGPGLARAHVSGERHPVFDIEMLPPQQIKLPPGTCLKRSKTTCDIQAADGPVRLHISPPGN